MFAFGATAFAGPAGAGLLHGLKVVAVAVVAQAVWGMARTLTPDRERASIALAAVLIVISQLPALLGLRGAWTFDLANLINFKACAFGLGSLAVLVTGRKLAPIDSYTDVIMTAK